MITKFSKFSLNKNPNWYSANYLNEAFKSINGEIFYNIDGEIKETKIHTFEGGGGLIILSTNVNVGLQTSLDKVRSYFKTFKNWITKEKKIRKSIERNMDLFDRKEFGYSIGNFFKGYYKASDGNIYSEKSLSIEIIGIDSDLLENIAKDLCNEFNQESVLVNDYSTGERYLENAE